MSDELVFPDGVVLTTPLLGIAAGNESVTLTGLLNADNLEHAVLTTFIIDEHWLLAHFNPTTTLTLVANGQVQSETSTQTPHNVVRVQPEFPKPHVQIVHSNILVLFYAHSMRFVVCTGNLVEDDWTIMHNCVYVQDFPMDNTRVFPANEFSLALAYSLLDLSIPVDVVARFNHVDFARAADVHIITSVPTGGVRQNAYMDEYGMLRIAKVIKQLYGPKPIGDSFDPDTRLYCVGSSLGRLDYRWLREFYLCAHGIVPRSMRKYVFDYSTPNDMVDVGIAFHTQAQVEECRYGVKCAQNVMAKRSVYENRDFPRDALVHIEPVHKNTLVHVKAMVARVGENQDEGWVYIGSHNCTTAAWGTLHGNEPPYFNNYEFGVILSGVLFEKVEGGKGVRAVWKERSLELPFNIVWNPYYRDDVPYFGS
ncbi:hypothetical protein FBU31_000847 [Coemansia sp. 'formosensis']|nr:hypothetical protein FBU31_000847 [Coemansia sp. 'formosensis']